MNREDRRGRSRVEKAPQGGWHVLHWYGTDHTWDWKTAVDSANVYARLSWEMR